ncbi:putative transposase (plasmid) [Rhizobium grahamii CCGE 502]|uniref:Putative transposase n=2 Tax=Rhizobium grahamii TaxID=1120045 RepID=S3H330_9HYPH|nr:putative transposase [Rhizobium grahamii CCGE 502]
MEYAMVDAYIVKVHRHGKGAKGDSEPGHGLLQGGMTTEILALTDERGSSIYRRWSEGTLVISKHPIRAQPLPLDAEMYAWRHLIENFICKLKEFKRIAVRADKTYQSFNTIIHLAAAVINSG